jgi:hypothetical protein
MKYYELALDGDQADALVVAVLKDTLESAAAYEENKDISEALKKVINYFSVPDQHI